MFHRYGHHYSSIGYQLVSSMIHGFGMVHRV